MKRYFSGMRLPLLPGHAALVIVLSLGGLLAAAEPAAAWCNPNRTNDGVSYFDGWHNAPTVGGYALLVVDISESELLRPV